MIGRSLWRNRRGATMAEFALILMPLMTVLAGAIEAGNIAYSRSVIEGTLRVASRMATTGKYSSADIDAYVRGQLHTLRIPDSDILITRKSYATFDGVGHPEPITSDVPPLGGAPGKGDCYIDLNGDGKWSSDAGIAGDGNSEDILYYGVTAKYDFLFTFLSSTFGGSAGKMNLSANTVVKNEPYGEPSNAAPVTRCIS